MNSKQQQRKMLILDNINMENCVKTFLFKTKKRQIASDCMANNCGETHSISAA